MSLIRELEVLWADDEKEYVEAALPGIADLVKHLEWASDGEGALAALRSASFDLVLLDLRMPPGQWGGLWVLEEAGSALTSQVPFIVLSGAGTLRQCVQALRLGAADYVEKECVAADLRDCIERIVAERQAKRPSADCDPEVAALILAGESFRTEFKSSLRWDMREGRKNVELEKATVKTVAGFLNAEGGTLLLGIADDGSSVGLENDYSTLQKANRDGFALHLINLLVERFGKDLAPCIRLTFHRLADRDVCRVAVLPAPRPVLFVEGGTEFFYLRTGNSTRPLSLSELLAYEKQRWGAGAAR